MFSIIRDNYLLRENYIPLLIYFRIISTSKMSVYFYYFSQKNYTIIKIAYVLLV